MTHDEYNAFCATLPAATYVVQWRGSLVWKVGAKVFAISGQHKEGGVWFTFKVSDIAFEILGDQPGVRPAPYFASRGMKWMQNYAEPGLTDDDLKNYLRTSHHLVSMGLTKKKQKELNLNGH